MRPKKINGKTFLVCPKCGYKVPLEENEGETYKIKKKIKHSVKEKTVVLDKDAPEVLPKLKDVVYCPKCGYNIVYYWVVQTRSADEPPTRFYKCARCGYVWREYE